MGRGILLAGAVTLSLALAGCSAVVDGSGGHASPTRVAPCALAPSPSAPSGGSSAAARSSAAAAPGCIPSPSPSPTTTGPSSRWANFARSVFTTKLGDPALLNVCAVALEADLPSGLTLARPTATSAAGCLLDLDRAVSSEPVSVSISVLRDRTTVFPRGATRTTVAGQTVLAGPYADGDCQRVMLLPQPDVTTSVQVRIIGMPGSAKTACGLTDTVVARFAAVAAGTVPVPTIPTAAPSLLGLDACKVAAAAGLSALPVIAGLGRPEPDGFDTRCSYTGTSGSSPSEFDLITGLLRSSSDIPEGAAVTVAGHRLYRQGGSTFCRYTSEQAEGETVEAFYASASGTPSLNTCDQVAGALGRYLDVLGLS